MTRTLKPMDETDTYVCGDCGLECNMEDRLKYCDPKCPACKYEINMLLEINISKISLERQKTLNEYSAKNKEIKE